MVTRLHITEALSAVVRHQNLQQEPGCIHALGVDLMALSALWITGSPGLLSPFFLKIERERFGPKVLCCYRTQMKVRPEDLAENPGAYRVQGENKVLSSRTIIMGWLYMRTLPRALPSWVLAGGFIFLPRVSNLSPLERHWVTQVRLAFVGPLPALYFKNLIKPFFPSTVLTWFFL